METASAKALASGRNSQEASQCRQSRSLRKRAGEMSQRGKSQDGASPTRSKHSRETRAGQESFPGSGRTKKDGQQLAPVPSPRREILFICAKGKRGDPRLLLSQTAVGVALVLRHRE